MPDPTAPLHDPAPSGRVERVGSDWVTLAQGRLIVHAAAPMDGWEVRKARKNRILFRDAAWEVVAVAPGRQGTIRYELAPFPENTNDLPGRDIPYGTDVAVQRDVAERRAVRRNREALGLLLILPLVGLLWSGTRRRLMETHDLDARDATRASLAAQWLALLLLGATASIMLFTGAWGAIWALRPGVLVALAAVIGLDALMRYDSLHDESESPPGFYEWLRRMKLR